MKEVTVKLGSIADVEHFVRAASTQGFNIDAISGVDRVDAKSFMGLFSLDLRQPIRIAIDGEEPEISHFLQVISPMILM